ncbi:hypothetical protein [Halobacillus hunanensis]|uniref:hypothetical protein n=1 Tax=Halobacillus hunanensis TaxID=578214 RepID=UPI0009A6C1E8|nr:hypothetical protein [Halobacillus hunanensis]
MRGRVLTFIILAGAFCFMAGCSLSASPEKDENVVHIETVVKEIFTGPEDELAAIYERGGKAAFEDYMAYYEEALNSYFTDDYYTIFFNKNLPTGFHMTAFRNGYQMEVKDVTVKQNETTETAYDFTVDVNYKKEGSEEESMEMRGRVNVNEDDKITRVVYHNGGQLILAMDPAR